LGARELAKRNAIIRRLASAETLGATTIICSDKTGTLTKVEMTARKIYTNDKTFEVTGVGYEAKGEFLLNGEPVNAKEDVDLNLLLGASAVCTNASYNGETILGDTTEGALIVAAAKAGMTKESLEKKYPRVHEIPFTSERKRMTTVHKMSEDKILAFMKGAPEVVLNRCTKIAKNGEATKLGKKEKTKILQTNSEMAKNALRVLGVAFKELTELDIEDFREQSKAEEINRNVETEMTFIGLVGMIDPPREEAKEANKLCQGAGIKTIMITGDHKLTAVAVAKEIGIVEGNSDDKALTGTELDAMSEEEFDDLIEHFINRGQDKIELPTFLQVMADLADKKKQREIELSGQVVDGEFIFDVPTARLC
jgi:Ca2+-transporting ATPase